MSIAVNRTGASCMKRVNNKLLYMGWVICGLGALFYSYEYLLRITPSVMTVELMNHYGIGADGLGFLGGIYYFAYVPMQLPVGVLMDRFGPRRLLTFACLCCVIGTYAIAASSNFSYALMGRFIVGFGSAFAFVGVLKLASIWLPQGRFALFAGIAAALGKVGGMVGSDLMLVAIGKFGWQVTIYLSAIVGIVISLLLSYFIHDEKPGEEKFVAKNNFPKVFSELGIILRNPQIWINGLIGCLIYLPTTVLAEQWIQIYLKQAHHLSAQLAAYGQNALYLGFTIGAPLMGWISDRLNSRRGPLFVGAVVASILCSILVYVPNLGANLGVGIIYLLLLTIGFFYGAQAIVFAIGREHSPPDASGTAIAVTNMLVMLGGMFLQPLVGYLLDWYARYFNSPLISSHIYSPEAYRFALSLVPIGMMISAVLVLFLRDANTKVKAH